jgi:hypothetical protein
VTSSSLDQSTTLSQTLPIDTSPTETLSGGGDTQAIVMPAPTAAEGPPYWIWIIVAVVVLVLIAVAIAIYVRLKSRAGKDSTQNETPASFPDGGKTLDGGTVAYSDAPDLGSVFGDQADSGAKPTTVIYSALP